MRPIYLSYEGDLMTTEKIESNENYDYSDLKVLMETITMSIETLEKIQSDVSYMLEHGKLTLGEAMTAINTYLFALAQHEVINLKEYKLLVKIIIESLMDGLKAKKDGE